MKWQRRIAYIQPLIHTLNIFERDFSISILSCRASIGIFIFFSVTPDQINSAARFRAARPPITQLRLVAATFSLNILCSAWLAPLSQGDGNNAPIHVIWVWAVVPTTLTEDNIYLFHNSLFNLNRYVQFPPGQQSNFLRTEIKHLHFGYLVLSVLPHVPTWRERKSWRKWKIILY